MNLNTEDELFVANLIGGIDQAIRTQGGGNIDRTWAISSRFAEILAVQAKDCMHRLKVITLPLQSDQSAA